VAILTSIVIPTAYRPQHTRYTLRCSSFPAVPEEPNMHHASPITPSEKQSTPILACVGLSKHVLFEGQRLEILRDIDLQLQAGESLAIVGASGSGKSTLLSLLAGLDVPDSGSVRAGGLEISALVEEQRALWRAANCSFVFQNFQLMLSCSALENVALPLELRGDRNALAKAKHWLHRVGLGERLQHTPRQLSGGEQQRVAIARAFVAEPRLLFADEPTGNLDHANGERIADLLFELNAEQACTLILVTHEERLAARCQRRLHLHAGRRVDPA
jgi:putative ABC transport system ATP-binding protein